MLTAALQTLIDNPSLLAYSVSVAATLLALQLARLILGGAR